VPSPLDIYTGLKEHSSTVQSLTYSTEKLVETVGTAATTTITKISITITITTITTPTQTTITKQ
jgi:hypothetical protein